MHSSDCMCGRMRGRGGHACTPVTACAGGCVGEGGMHACAGGCVGEGGMHSSDCMCGRMRGRGGHALQ